MKYAAAIIFAFIFGGCYHNSAFYYDGMLKEKRYLANHDASVQLKYVSEGRVWVTSGKVIDKKNGVVLSVAHGIHREVTKIFVRMPPDAEDDEWLEARLLAVDFEWDMAIMTVDPAKAKFQREVVVSVRNSSELESERVYLVSYPFGFLQHTPTFGYIVSVHPRRSDIGDIGYPHLAVHIWAQRGSSGGSLFLQSDHKLVGLTRFYVNGDSTYPTLLFIPPEKIREFLDKNGIKYNR